MEQEKVTEELVRQNGNQAAAVMADYAAQGGVDSGSVLCIEFNVFMNTIAVKDADGNTLFTTTANVESNLRYTVYSTTAVELHSIIGNSNVYFHIQNVQVTDSVRVNYTSPVLPNMGLPIPFLFTTDVMPSITYYETRYVGIQCGYSFGMLYAHLDLCSAFDHQLSMQTGFPLFQPSMVGTATGKCIIGGMICEYTANGYVPIDEVVDGSDTTMSRKLGLNVDHSVFGQLLNMYHNTIIGQLGGGGGE